MYLYVYIRDIKRVSSRLFPLSLLLQANIYICTDNFLRIDTRYSSIWRRWISVSIWFYMLLISGFACIGYFDIEFILSDACRIFDWSRFLWTFPRLSIYVYVHLCVLTPCVCMCVQNYLFPKEYKFNVLRNPLGRIKRNSCLWAKQILWLTVWNNFSFDAT